MAKYNIYGHVLYSEIEYEKLMYTTERIFINALINRIPNIDKWTSDIWDTIDHEYMIKTLEEIKRDVIREDSKLFIDYKRTGIDVNKAIEIIDNVLEDTSRMKDKFRLEGMERFRQVEHQYGKDIAKDYKTRIKTIDSVDETEYLTKQIKNFKELEQTIPYKNGRAVTPSTYLSMLYNVNLTRIAWNQTFKDAEYFDKDIMKLEYHPLSCPRCAPKQEKLYSISGKSKIYPSIQEAYENGIGHPNCKCQWSIYWSKEQMQPLPYEKTTKEDYKLDQKRKAIEREIRRQENDRNLYQMIGNYSEVDKCTMRIEKLQSKL